MDVGNDPYDLVATAKQLDQLWTLLRTMGKVNVGGSAETPTRKPREDQRGPIKSSHHEVILIDENEEDSVIDLMDDDGGGEDFMVDDNDGVDWKDTPVNREEGQGDEIWLHKLGWCVYLDCSIASLSHQTTYLKSR